MIEPLLYQALSESSQITALAGNNIWGLTLPENSTLPALTYQIISCVTDPTFSTVGQRKYRIQIDCWAESYLASVSLRGAVIQTLDGYQDDALGSAWLLQQIDFFDQHGLEYRASCEFYILSNQ